MLDYGSGSGVLAIAALLAGAASATATDIDSVAVASCATNAALNGFQDRLRSVLCQPLDPASSLTLLSTANLLAHSLQPVWSGRIKSTPHTLLTLRSSSGKSGLSCLLPCPAVPRC